MSLQAATAPDIALNKKMSQLGQAMSNLFPLAVDGKRLDTSESQKILKDNIAALVDTVPTVMPHFAQKSLTYQLSFDIIQDHINDLQKAFENKRYNHVKSMLRATASICVSCHSQDKQRRTIFEGLPRQQFKSDFSYAEYNYITRNYDQAERFYLSYLNNPGKHDKEADQLTALRNLLSIYTQILNDVGKGAEVFGKIQKNKHLTVYAKKKVSTWLSGMKQIASLSGHDDDGNFERINSLVKQYIEAKDSPSKLEYLYWIRGMVYRYLSTSPKNDEIPVLLYWLALTERGTTQNVYFSLGDLYLKECMLIYPNTSIAKKCYDEYEDAITFSYSGSRGTEIPEDIQDDLKKFKEMVNPNIKITD